MYHYLICNAADDDVYEKQCAALVKYIPGITRVEELQDVDGGRHMRYTYKNNAITVSNSIYRDSVYVESGIDLEQFFSA